MKNLIYICLLLIFSNKIFAQTNFYVSPSGNNANTGTSISTAWQTIQHAANTAIPDSIVNILAGTYNELVSINVNGTAINPIVFRNYQNDVVLISGSGFTASFSNLIMINSKNNIEIKGLILENLSTPFANGILVVSNVGAGIENITLKDLKIRNIRYSADVNPGIPVAGNNAHGIEIYGKGITELDVIRNIKVENCEIYNNVNGFSENLTVNGNVSNFALINNSVHDNTNIGIDVAGNFGASANSLLDHARNGIISGNETYNNVSQVANSSGIYCDGCQNTIIERNQTHHNTVGITVGCEPNGTADFVYVYNNFVYHNTYTGIQIGGYNPATTGIVNNSEISNNTCFHNDITNLHGELLVEKVNNCKIFNNIFNTAGTLLMYIDNINPQNYTSNYNLFHSSSPLTVLPFVNYRFNTIQLSNYQTTTKKDLNSELSFPNFVSNTTSNINLHLHESSLAINMGDPGYVALQSVRDIDGENRNNNIVDIGADEFYGNLTVYKNTVEDFVIYPNPSNDFISILNTDHENGTIQIYNSMGQLIKKAPVTKGLQINISNLSKAIYFIKLNDNAKTLKFVKN